MAAAGQKQVSNTPAYVITVYVLRAVWVRTSLPATPGCRHKCMCMGTQPSTQSCACSALLLESRSHFGTVLHPALSLTRWHNLPELGLCAGPVCQQSCCLLAACLCCMLLDQALQLSLTRWSDHALNGNNLSIDLQTQRPVGACQHMSAHTTT